MLPRSFTEVKFCLFSICIGACSCFVQGSAHILLLPLSPLRLFSWHKFEKMNFYVYKLHLILCWSFFIISYTLQQHFFMRTYSNKIWEQKVPARTERCLTAYSFAVKRAAGDPQAFILPGSTSAPEALDGVCTNEWIDPLFRKEDAFLIIDAHQLAYYTFHPVCTFKMGKRLEVEALSWLLFKGRDGIRHTYGLAYGLTLQNYIDN